MPVKKIKPSWVEEKVLWAEGINLVAGIDEVGRGALAGPVAAAAVILPQKLKARWCREVKDSKLLTVKERDYLSGKITEVALAFGVGLISPEEIDIYGIAKAARLAMKMAVEKLGVKPDSLLIDHFELPEVNLPQKGVPDGDSLCFSIACASIVAKVARDELMVGFDIRYPGYNLAGNKGYSTEEHLECLKRLGPSAIHRVSFQPVREAVSREMGRKETGALGEKLALDFLIKQGYTIVETNFRTGSGEIDIIAKKDDCLVFVEVRAKTSSVFGSPEESITPLKKEHLIAVANQYREQHESLPELWRIDLLAIELNRRGQPTRIELIENAVSES